MNCALLLQVHYLIVLLHVLECLSQHLPAHTHLRQQLVERAFLAALPLYQLRKRLKDLRVNFLLVAWSVQSFVHLFHIPIQFDLLDLLSCSFCPLIALVLPVAMISFVA